MVVYLILNVSIIILAIVLCGLMRNPKTIKYLNNNDLPTNIFVGISFLILLLVSGFRGDFTSDYGNYAELFKTFTTLSFPDLFSSNIYQETGYVLLNWLIGCFTNNAVFLMLITSFIILFFIFRELKNDSVNIWLSILLFINVGAYYTSFNIIRQILAAAIVFSASKYLYSRRLVKYLIIISIAVLIHKTSLIMIPFYFLLNFKFNKKNIIIIFGSSVVTVLCLDKIMSIVQKFWYSGYTYGMTGLNITSIVAPVALMIFVLFHSKILELDQTKYNIWINATIFYTFFSILGLKVQMVQRLAEFFSPYVLLIVPYTISRIIDKNSRVIYYVIITLMLVAYNYVILSGTGYDAFYFIWQKA